MRKPLFQCLSVSVASIFLWACSSHQPADNKEVELLRKETELAKKEAELAKKELEMLKGSNSTPNIISAPPSPSPTPSFIPSTNVSGYWVIKYTSDGFAGRMDLRITQSGDELLVASKSYVGGDSGSWRIEPGGRIKGNKITFFLEEKGERVRYSGAVSGDTMKGTMSFGGTWGATRQL